MLVPLVSTPPVLYLHPFDASEDPPQATALVCLKKNQQQTTCCGSIA